MHVCTYVCSYTDKINHVHTIKCFNGFTPELSFIVVLVEDDSAGCRKDLEYHIYDVAT